MAHQTRLTLPPEVDVDGKTTALLRVSISRLTWRGRHEHRAPPRRAQVVLQWWGMRTAQVFRCAYTLLPGNPNRAQFHRLHALPMYRINRGRFSFLSDGPVCVNQGVHRGTGLAGCTSSQHPTLPDHVCAKATCGACAPDSITFMFPLQIWQSRVRESGRAQGPHWRPLGLHMHVRDQVQDTHVRALLAWYGHHHRMRLHRFVALCSPRELLCFNKRSDHIHKFGAKSCRAGEVRAH